MGKNQSTQKVNEEIIVCFRRDVLSKYLVSSGKIFYDEELWKLLTNHFEFLPRSTSEMNYEYKQLVAYILIKAGKSYLTYRRTMGSEEEQLRRKHSLGIGGHINLDDRNQSALHSFNHKKSTGFMLRGVWREIKEEVDIKSSRLREPTILCFINDDSDAVGWKHFGVVWLVEIEKPNVLRKGKGIGKIEFRDIDYLKKNRSYFEKWSQLLIDYLSTS